MANDENLKKGVNTRFQTGEKQAEIARKGGIASGKAKREKKALKDAFETVLNMRLSDGDAMDLEEIQSFAAVRGQNITVQEAIAIKMVQNALMGDIRAAEFVRDSSGQRPDESMKLEMTVPVMFGGEDELED